MSNENPRTPPPEKAKAQLHFALDAEGGIVITVYDPVAFDNFKPEEEGILAIIEKLDPSSELVTLLTFMISLGSYFPSVKKVVDARTGHEIDVSTKDFSKGMKSSRAWSKSHIKEVYEDRVERGIIDPGDFSFEEFEKDFRENNR